MHILKRIFSDSFFHLANVFMFSFFLSGCGTAVDTSITESSTAYINSALSLVTQALNLKEAVAPFQRNFLFPQLTTDSCTVAGGGITASSCGGGGLQSYTYNNCAGQFTGAIYTGSLDFNFSSTCSFSLSSGQDVTVTTTDFKTTLADLTFITWSSATHSNYLDTSFWGGYQIANDSGNLTLVPLGIRKIYANADGSSIFEHTIRANSNLPQISISPSFADGSRSVSGNIVVDSNTESFTADISFVGVTFGLNSCGHPTVGTINVSFGGSKTGTQNFEFVGTCGSIQDSDTGTIYTLDPPI